MGSSLLDRSVRLLTPSRLGNESVAIRLLRDAAECELRARLGRSDIESLSFDGSTLTVRTQDFIVNASDVVFPTYGRTSIQKGDRIEWVRDGVTMLFDVLPIEGGRCVEPVDVSGVLVRIHTKKADV